MLHPFCRPHNPLHDAEFDIADDVVDIGEIDSSGGGGGGCGAVV